MLMTRPTTRGVMGTSSFRSVPDMWHHRVGSTPDATAMIFRDRANWNQVTWKEAAARVRYLANALLAFGIEPEQRCAILSKTRYEWVLVDMAILCAGGATSTIYPANTAEECEFICNDCSARVVFCDTQEQVFKLLQKRETLTSVERVIVFDGEGTEDGWVQALSRFESEGVEHEIANPDAYDKVSKNIRSDQLATLIYTSGTTGQPKGVMLTHDAWVYEAEAIDAMGLISPADKHYLFLPLAHVFAKVMEVIFIRLGVPTVVDGNMEALIHNLGETEPTWVAAVPRVFEKAYNRIVSEARDSGKIKYNLFKWAIDVGRQVSGLRQKGRQPHGLLRVKFALADKLVFQDIKERFGGRIRFFISGGAPLPKELAEFFHAMDILILEGYGLTESGAASCVNSPDDYVFGTVGKPVPGCELRIDTDGEILLRSRGNMVGYHQQPEDTDQCLDDDGWLRTGDIGMVLDSGHLMITDRKKAIIVTAGGKNVAPAHFENLLRSVSPFVADVVMHGDRRSFCTALVTINEDTAGPWARSEGIVYEDYADLASKPEVRALAQQAIDDVNRQLPSFERVRKFAILAEPFTVENGTLTPSLKVKRSVVVERYADQLDAFYEGTVARL